MGGYIADKYGLNAPAAAILAMRLFITAYAISIRIIRNAKRYFA